MSLLLLLRRRGGGLTTVLDDTFTGVAATALEAHSPDSGPAWAVGNGAMVLDGSGHAVGSGGASGVGHMYFADTGKVNLTATLLLTPASGGQPCLVVRATDSSHHWLVDCVVGGTIILYEYNTAYVNKAAGPTTVTAAAHTLVVALSGNTITVTLDGVAQISYASATFNNTATKIGLRTANTTDLFDRLTVVG